MFKTKKIILCIVSNATYRLKWKVGWKKLNKKPSGVFLVFLFFTISLIPNFSYSQRGKDGNKIVVSTEIVNEYTYLTAPANAGTNILIVNDAILNSNNRFNGPLTNGDLLFIIQIQGASTNSYLSNGTGVPNDSSWGAIISYNNCGNHELIEVCSVSGNTITTYCKLKNSYSDTGKTQVIRVPRYNTLTINNGGKITCEPWNGRTGGVIALEILGQTTINNGGSIDASEKGFRGGQVHNSVLWNTFYFATLNPDDGAEKGESILGYGSELTKYGGHYCKGAPANGGGGGNGNNGGGGGGANAGNINQWTGKGIPDNSNPQWTQAWNLEYPGFANHISSGGGRGGYTASQQNLNALTTGPGGHPSCVWGGDCRQNNGGLGGRPLDYSTGRLFLGGGGGAGDGNNGYAGAGGNGGGLIYIQAYDNITGFGQILSNGQNGGDAVGPTPGMNGITGIDGAGGGGAGGTIYINTTGTISNITILANGGRGGNQIIKKGVFTNDDQAEGPGGGGGGGYIITSQTVSVTKQVFGGVNGTTNSSGVTEFPPNGATKGADGIIASNLTTPLFLTTNDTICMPTNAEICANLLPSFPGASIFWYETQTSCTPINNVSSNCLTTPVINQTTTYMAGFCPGSYRVPVKVVLQPLIVNAGSDTTICRGSSYQFNVSPSNGVSYQWSPSVNPPNVYNPIVTPQTTTTYSVTVSTANNCVGTDEVKITVVDLQIYASNDTTICRGDSIMIYASGGQTYQWAEPPLSQSMSDKTIPNPIVYPTVTTIYTVTVTSGNGSCIATETVKVNVSSVSAIISNQNVLLCQGESVTLNACNSVGTQFQWSPPDGLNNINICNPTATPSLPTTYTVTVSNEYNCKSTASIIVYIYPSNMGMLQANQTISICQGEDTMLVAWGGNLYQWSQGATPLSVDSIAIVSPTTNTTYSVTITDKYNCTKVFSCTINVTGLIADAGKDTSICSGQTVQLNASGGIYYNWAPSTGLSATNIQNPIANPTTTTTYTVTVSTSANCKAEDSVTVFVEVPQAKAYPLFDTAICKGGIAKLYATGLERPGQTYQWAPNYNLSSTTSKIVFASPLNTTTYTVTVYLNPECYATDDVTVFVDNELVVASVHLSDTAGCEPLTVTFNSTSQNASFFYWNFGGLGSSISPNTKFTFNNDGLYQFVHTVQSSSQVCADTLKGWIRVYPLPEPDFTFTPSEPLMSEEITFNDITIGNIINRIWNFNDENYIYFNKSPIYSFKNYGQKKIVLTVTNNFGCTDSITKIIDVKKNVILTIPNVFTPDKNGLNERFVIQGIEFAQDNVLYVFNRWGRLVYYKTNYNNDWDGSDVEDGTYYIVFKYLSDIVYTGTLTIIRKD